LKTQTFFLKNQSTPVSGKKMSEELMTVDLEAIARLSDIPSEAKENDLFLPQQTWQQFVTFVKETVGYALQEEGHDSCIASQVFHALAQCSAGLIKDINLGDLRVTTSASFGAAFMEMMSMEMRYQAGSDTAKPQDAIFLVINFGTGGAKCAAYQCTEQKTNTELTQAFEIKPRCDAPAPSLVQLGDYKPLKKIRDADVDAKNMASFCADISQELKKYNSKSLRVIGFFTGDIRKFHFEQGKDAHDLGAAVENYLLFMKNSLVAHQPAKMEFFFASQETEALFERVACNTMYTYLQKRGKLDAKYEIVENQVAGIGMGSMQFWFGMMTPYGMGAFDESASPQKLYDDVLAYIQTPEGQKEGTQFVRQVNSILKKKQVPLLPLKSGFLLFVTSKKWKQQINLELEKVQLDVSIDRLHDNMAILSSQILALAKENLQISTTMQKLVEQRNKLENNKVKFHV